VTITRPHVVIKQVLNFGEVMLEFKYFFQSIVSLYWWWYWWLYFTRFHHSLKKVLSLLYIGDFILHDFIIFLKNTLYFFRL